MQLDQTVVPIILAVIGSVGGTALVAFINKRSNRIVAEANACKTEVEGTVMKESIGMEYGDKIMTLNDWLMEERKVMRAEFDSKIAKLDERIKDLESHNKILSERCRELERENVKLKNKA